MALTGTAKRIAIVGALAGAVLLLDQVFGPDDSAPVVAGAAATKRASLGGSARAASAREAPAVPEPVQALELQRLDGRQAALAQVDVPGPGGDPFGPVSWKPSEAVVPAAPPLPPPKPVAPAFPYTYLGALTEDGVRTIFLARGDRVLPVRAGDLVDAAYRIDSMNDKQMSLTYLPLNEPMVVALGGGP